MNCLQKLVILQFIFLLWNAKAEDIFFFLFFEGAIGFRQWEKSLVKN